MPTAEEIIDQYNQRKAVLGPRIERMRELREAYEGEISIPLPELSASERPMVANLIAQGLDQTAMRIASTMPDVVFPSIRPGIQMHENRAADRRRAVLSWWSMNELSLIQRKRARWLVGYAMAPVVICPDTKRQIPLWQARDPLTTYPPPGDEMTPLDCIFTFSRTLHFLQQQYPEHARALYKGRDPKPDNRFTLVEYVDSEVHVLLALGRERGEYETGLYAPGGKPFIELERFPNRAGICPAVVPGRIGLDRGMGQFDGLIGLFWNQAKLMALELIAIQRGIFPDEWLISRQNEVAQIVNEADGLRGEIGSITGGDLVSKATQPGVQTYPTIDRIERAMRLTGGIPAEYGGESTSNIRTGRRGQAVLSAAVDYPIQEMQEVLAASLKHENIRAIAIDKTYFGGRKAFYVNWNGERGLVEYDPGETFDTDEHSVYYSYPGADINQLIIGTGQRIGMGTMSKRRGMELDPLIDDPQLEHGRVLAESLEQAGLQALQQAVASGQVSPDDWAYIAEQVMARRKPLYEAVQLAQERAQKRQASMGELGTPEGPVEAGAPEAQPGLTPNPQAAAATIAGPTPAQSNLSQLLASLRRPAMALPQERAG